MRRAPKAPRNGAILLLKGLPYRPMTPLIVGVLMGTVRFHFSIFPEKPVEKIVMSKAEVYRTIVSWYKQHGSVGK